VHPSRGDGLGPECRAHRETSRQVRAGLFSQPAQVSSPGDHVRGIRQRARATDVLRRGCEEDRECKGKTRGEKFAASVIRDGLRGGYYSLKHSTPAWCEAGARAVARMAD
jgi:hypothetical protein